MRVPAPIILPCCFQPPLKFPSICGKVRFQARYLPILVTSLVICPWVGADGGHFGTASTSPCCHLCSKYKPKFYRCLFSWSWSSEPFQFWCIWHSFTLVNSLQFSSFPGHLRTLASAALEIDSDTAPAPGEEKGRKSEAVGLKEVREKEMESKTHLHFPGWAPVLAAPSSAPSALQRGKKKASAAFSSSHQWQAGCADWWEIPELS